MLPDADHSTQAWVSEAYGKLPLSFEVNHGQTDPQVKLLSRGRGYNLFLTSTEAVLALRKAEVGSTDSASSSKTAVLHMKVVGSNPQPPVEGLSQLPGKSNYLIGNDSKKWRTNIPAYAKVKYHDVYPGIDLVYYGNRRQLEYDFVLAAGAKPGAITLGFEGADKLEVDAEGDLVLHTAVGQIRQRRPVVYQEMDGIRQEISGGYVLKGNNEVGFEVAAYDARKPLIIDPVLSYSTLLGGSSAEAIAVDSSGNAYVTGLASSPDFPTRNPLQGQGPDGGPGDAFVTKLNRTGTELAYSTYLGGSAFDTGLGIAVDPRGNAYVTGRTVSPDFPTKNPFQSALLGFFEDAFVTKLNRTGSELVYSTFLGGDLRDIANGIAVDSSGNAYLTGFTDSPDFPTRKPFQSTLGGEEDVFVTKLNRTGTELVYSTFLGGAEHDEGFGIAVDSPGTAAYLTGITHSSDFPTRNPFQSALRGTSDTFVTKLNRTGSELGYSTYLGGSNEDRAFGGIAVDSRGNAWVAGETNSPDFPTINPVQAILRGESDAFVTKLNRTGSELAYSTYLGGGSFDGGTGISVDPQGNAYMTGITSSLDFPTQDPFQPIYGGGSDDAFVTKLDRSGTELVYSTYLGGSDTDFSFGIAVDPRGNAYVTGETSSSDFPTTPGAFQTTGGGAFIAKVTD